jgi:hypothetical protein
MWADIVDTVTRWPWATIAAFAAAGAAIAVARSETSERRQLLGRQTVVDVNAGSLVWYTKAGDFLRSIRQFFDGLISANHLNGEPLERFTGAVADMERILTSARMACNDFELLLRVAEAQSKLHVFTKRLERSPEETYDDGKRRLGALYDDGQALIKEFGQAIDAFVTRGFAVYSPRRGIRFRLRERQFNRLVKAAEAQKRTRTDVPDDDGQS